ncbi:glycosyltransferase family 4 protein [Reichenbachiella versicolor]|uniref:glycosyltransferase family 4 protein n=1 Tax=Reichenbachiella versicolor TaxID=1821036 RepID=UPI000D6E6FC4|nr:glycosyltransferase family 4 protein [Reichenbachiella versicolor]
MKILISIANLKLGGAQIVALRLAKALEDEGHVVHVYDHFPDVRVSGMVDEHYPCIKLYSITENEMLRWFIWKINVFCIYLRFDFFRWMNMVVFMFRANMGYEVIHSHMFDSDEILSRCKFWRVSPKLVVTMHGCYEERFAISQLDYRRGFLKKAKRIISKVDSVFFLTKKNIAFINEINLKKLPRLIKTYNGIDLVGYSNVARDFDIENKPNVILGMTGRGVKDKGWELAINVVIKANVQTNRCVELFIISDGDYISYLEQKYLQFDYIKFLGFQANVIPYLKEIDVGLLPSRTKSESLPTSIIEFMALGIPIIASDVGEIKNMIYTGVNSDYAGIVISEHDKMESEIVRELVALIGSSSYYKTLSDNCKLAVKKFDIKKVLNGHLAIYTEEH